jgi:hypothetical protein
VDEGSHALAIDSATGIAYAVTYAGDTVSAISAQGDALLGRYGLPEPQPFGTLISSAALANSILFLSRTLIQKIALLDTTSGKTLKQITSDDLGVATIASVLAGASGHVFVFAAGPVRKTSPFIAEALILELDEAGDVVRRATMPALSGSYPAYEATASGSWYDRLTGSLFFGAHSALNRVGAVAVLGPNDRQARELFSMPDGAWLMAADSRRQRLYVASDRLAGGGTTRPTRVEVYSLVSGTKLSTTDLDTELGSATVDEQRGLLFATAPLRDREADQLLMLDATSLAVLARGDIPWDPYAHGLAVDSARAHVFVSARVRQAYVTTFTYGVRP